MMIFTKYFFLAAMIFILCCFNLANAADKLPRPIGYVNDYAGVINSSSELKINSIVKELKQKTGAEVAVVTLKSLDKQSPEDVALNIGREWKIGQKGKDNGVVFLIVPNERVLRIEVGYGLEQFITDAGAGRIRDNYIIPYFKQGDMDKGILMGSAAIVQKIAKGYGVKISGEYTPVASKTSKENGIINLLFVLFFIIFAIKNPNAAFFMVMMMGNGGRSSYGGGSFGGSSFGGFGGAGGFGGGGASGRW